mmetsp:Transcript_28449/g.43562  ORF Transcript_28449/g.43562 Transcript_28449/m.43562 type:complete len:560 (-) Transcript_28449:115-1794(-)
MKTKSVALAFFCKLLAVSAADEWFVSAAPKKQFAGNSISLTSTFLAVGGPWEGTGEVDEKDNFGGQVHIFGTDTKEMKLKTMLEKRGHPGDEFGYSVAASADSNTFIVGAPDADAGGTKRGYAMVFHFNEFKNDWVQMGTMILGTQDNGRAGRAVDISDDGMVVAIGSKGDELLRGNVRLYQYEEVSNGWAQLGGDIEGHSQYTDIGHSISLIGSMPDLFIAAGGPGYKQSKGIAAVYYWYAEGQFWDNLGQETDIVGNMEMDQVGTSVSLAKQGLNVYLAVGAPSQEYYGGEEIGDLGTDAHAQVFKYRLLEDDYDDDSWQEYGPEIEQMEEDDETGACVALSRDGQRLAVSSPGYDGRKGLVRVFDYDTNSNQYVMVGRGIEGNEKNDHHGEDVSINGDKVAISSAYGSYVYIYTFGKKSRFLIAPTTVLLIAALGLIASCCVYGCRKARRNGFKLSSVGKALPLGSRNKQRHESERLNTEEKQTEWPFPFFSEGERARIAQVQKAEEGKNMDRVVLHGMIKSDDASRGSGVSGSSNNDDSDDCDSDSDDDGVNKII